MAVGAVVAILIIGAVAVLGYYQFTVGPSLKTTSTVVSTSAVTCTPTTCAEVTIPSGASSPPAGYSGGTTTFGYTPDTITVVIGKNNTVQWTNDDTAPHTATSDPGAPAPFDSGMQGPLTSQGGTFQFTFTTPGTYHYHCSFHAWMQGTVIVVAGSGSSSSGSTSSSATST